MQYHTHSPPQSYSLLHLTETEKKELWGTLGQTRLLFVVSRNKENIHDWSVCDALNFEHVLRSLCGPLGMFFMQITDRACKLS